MALAACSAVPKLPEDPARELTRVPFFPQTIHQCGPAALSTVLGWSGVETTPEALAPQVYIPGRKGSLAIELAAATRRAGRIPYELPQESAAIFAEIAAGAPVLVLQDLGALGIRWWHFAVVIGADEASNLVVLRSGKERRRIERRDRFLASWERGGRWAMVALPPGRLPMSLAPGEVVRTLEGARQFLPKGATGETYAAAVARWPADPTVLFAAANDDYASGDLARAEQRYRALLETDPHHVAGLNNYANLMIDRGCGTEAARLAGSALANLGGEEQYRAAIDETLARARTTQGPCRSTP